MRSLSVNVVLVVVVSSSLSCGDETVFLDSAENPSATDSGLIPVWWRGNLVQAQVDGDLLLVEGDIEVGLVGQLGDIRQQALVVQDEGARWPGGTVPYDFAVNPDDANGVAPTAAQQTTIRNAMDDWEEAVPGLSFVVRSNEADYVSVYISNGNSSSIGRRSGQQFARVTAAQVGSFTMHHELAHALGFLHEHTRKDRGTWVQINWASIQGCPTGATSSDDCGCAAGNCGCPVGGAGCDLSGNFATDSARSDVLEYDYGSIMHYSVGAFSWTGGNTITTLQPLDGATVGNRTAFGSLDAPKMRVAYPVMSAKTFVFSDTGEQEFCRLIGRESDIGTEFTISGWPGSWNSSAVQTDGVGSMETTVTCQGQSVFFAESYDYPNTTVSPDLATYPGSSIETYSQTVNVVTQPIAIVAALL